MLGIHPPGKMQRLSKKEINMVKLCIFAGSIVLGWVGSWLGDQVGGITGAWLLGGVGSIAGVLVGWRIARDYLS